MTFYQYCFTVMSFKEDEDNYQVFHNGIKPAVESLGVEAYRVDQNHFTGRITDEIIEKIKKSYFVVAELSHQRPNCYYELGFAHALNKQVIMLIDDAEKIHFDIKDFNFIVYKSVEDLKQKLLERVKGSILTTNGHSVEDIRKGNFGRCAINRGRLLTATIIPVDKKYCNLKLRVIALPDSEPLTGNVTFYVHDTFDPATYTRQVRNGEAVLDIDSEGAFTVGARTDNRTIELELNLATLPGGNNYFYKH